MATKGIPAPRGGGDVKPYLRRLLVAIAIMFTVGVSASAVAYAAPEHLGSRVVDDAPAVSMCVSETATADRIARYASDYLPVTRWGDQTPVHTRLSFLSDPGAYIQREGIISSGLGIGNGAWGLGAGAAESATRFCIGENLTRVVDQATAKLGLALFSSGLLAFLAIAAIVSTLVRAARSGSAMPTLARIGITLGILAVLVTGASKTTDTSFGKASPGWWGSKINQSVSTVAAAPVAAIDDAALSTIQSVNVSTLPVSDCRVYTEVLRANYQKAFGAVAGGSSNVALAPRTMDSMWASSGLATWERVQFGGNRYAQIAGCRLLEHSAGWPVASSGSMLGQFDLSQQRVTASGALTSAKIPGANPAALAWNWANNDQEDAAMVGWAACQVKGGTISVAGKWAKAGVTDPDCKKFFQKPLADFDGGSLDIGSDVDDITAWSAQAPEEADYVLSLHGNQNAGAMATVTVYVVASIISGGAFVLLSAAVFVAKVALLALTFFSIWVLISGLVKPHDGNSKVVELGKHYIVIAFFAFGSSLLLAIVAMLTNILGSVASAAVPAGGLQAAFWVGIAPVAAIFLFHMFFTKVLKAPSPFKPTSAMAYGAAAAGTGMLAGASLERRMNSRARRVGRSATRIGEQAISRRMGGRSGGRIGGMAGTLGAGAAGGLAGAALAAGRDDPAPSASGPTAPAASEATETAGADGRSPVNPQQARDFAARGGRELPSARPDGTPLTRSDRAMTDARMRLEHRAARLRQLWDEPGGPPGALASRLGSAAKTSVARGVASAATSPGRTAAKVAGMGLLALSIPTGGGAAVAAVGGAWAAKRTVSAARRARRQRPIAQRQAEMSAFAQHQERRRLADQARATQVQAVDEQAAQDAADEANLPPDDVELREREARDVLVNDSHEVVALPAPDAPSWTPVRPGRGPGRSGSAASVLNS